MNVKRNVFEPKHQGLANNILFGVFVNNFLAFILKELVKPMDDKAKRSLNNHKKKAKPRKNISGSYTEVNPSPDYQSSTFQYFQKCLWLNITYLFFEYKTTQ